MATNPLVPRSESRLQAVERYEGFASGPRDEMSFSDVSRVLRKQRRVILIACLGGVVLALLVSLLMTPKYRSAANVELNPAEGNKLGLSDFSPDPGSSAEDLGTNLSTLVQMLRSDSLALEVIRQNNLEAEASYRLPKSAKYAAEAKLPLADAPLRRARILKRFESNLRIEPVPGTRLVQISFADPDSKRSAAVVNSLVANYTTDYIHRHYLGSVQASDWLQKQIADLKQQVASSENRVTDFEKQNGFFGFVGTGSDATQSPLLQKLVTLNQTVVQAESERIQKEAIAKLLATRDPEVIVGLGSNPQIANGVTGTDLTVLQSLRLREAQIQADYSEMQTKYGARYPALIETKNELTSIEGSITRTVNNLRSRAQNDYAVAAKNEAMLKQSFEEQVAEANKLNDKATQFQLLSKEAEGNRNLYQGLVTKLREAEVAASVRGANITPVDLATPMPTPSSPNYPLNLAIGLVGGLLLGLGAGVSRSRGDQAIENVEALEALAPAPILGAVPRLSRLKPSSSPKVLTSTLGERGIRGRFGRNGGEDKLAAEAYSQIRTSILLNAAGAVPRTILITSPLNGDGKSSIVGELAAAFAIAGARVLALDADLRHQATFSGSEQLSRKGLSDLLAQGGDPNEYVQPDSSVPNLFFLSSGALTGSPLVLLESPRFKELLGELKKSFDFILIDSPPISFFADVSVIAPHADATVLVVRAGVTSRQAFRRSCRTLLDANSKLLGVIVNDLALDSPNFYGYYGYRGKDFARSYAKV